MEQFNEVDDLDCKNAMPCLSSEFNEFSFHHAYASKVRLSERKEMIVSIFGGGNIGALMAGELASAGHKVRLCVSDPQIWKKTIEVYDQQDILLCKGELDLITSDVEDIVRGSDVILITYPTFLLNKIACRLLPCMEKGQLIGVVPGNDAEFFFSEHIKRGAILFGLQRVHCVARMRERGRSVYRLGEHRKRLHVAALPSVKTAMVAELIADLFSIPTEPLSCYLEETLTPSNPILHTTRIRTMFKDWKPGVTYDRNILFYEDWDIPSAELLLACDDELQRVCRSLETKLSVDLTGVRSLKVHYESSDARSMAAKISSIEAFKGLISPMKEVSLGKWVPDFSSRYFHADFAYGLKVIKDISLLAGEHTPRIDDVYDWYIRTAKPEDVFSGVPDTLIALSDLYR